MMIAAGAAAQDVWNGLLFCNNCALKFMAVEPLPQVDGASPARLQRL